MDANGANPVGPVPAANLLGPNNDPALVGNDHLRMPLIGDAHDDVVMAPAAPQPPNADNGVFVAQNRAARAVIDANGPIPAGNAAFHGFQPNRQWRGNGFNLPHFPGAFGGGYHAPVQPAQPAPVVQAVPAPVAPAPAVKVPEMDFTNDVFAQANRQTGSGHFDLRKWAIVFLPREHPGSIEQIRTKIASIDRGYTRPGDALTASRVRFGLYTFSFVILPFRASFFRDRS